MEEKGEKKSLEVFLSRGALGKKNPYQIFFEREDGFDNHLFVCTQTHFCVNKHGSAAGYLKCIH
jgi:hypothetical protein